MIRLTPEAAASAQFQTAKVDRRPLALGLTVPARVKFTQTSVAKVAARVSGRISAFKVTYGSRVKKGEVLAYLESPELARTRADYLSALTRPRVAEGNFRREKELLQKGITSERDMRQAVAETTVRSPRGGSSRNTRASGELPRGDAAVKGQAPVVQRPPAVPAPGRRHRGAGRGDFCGIESSTTSCRARGRRSSESLRPTARTWTRGG